MVSKNALVVLLVAAAIGGTSCELVQPKVPVSCSRRKSVLGQGDVIKIRNQTDKVLALWFDAGGKKVKFSIQPYAAVREFGWLEGFTLGENSRYTIGGEGFASATFSKDNEDSR